jgi:hypothetical protein
LPVSAQDAEAPAEEANPAPVVGAPVFGGPVNTSSVVSITEQTFSLPLVEANQLLQDSPSDSVLLVRLREMVAAGKARQERLIVLRTKSGQRAVSESLHELRFPTEFEPVLGPGEAKKAAPPAEPGATPVPNAPTPAPVFPKPPPAPGDTADSVFPMIFETRNVGDTLEVEPVVAPDGVTISINLVPKSVRFAGERVMNTRPQVKQPIFEVSEITTSVRVRDGVPYFLGTIDSYPAPGPDGAPKEKRAWLDFITAEIVRPETGSAPRGAASMRAKAQAMIIPKLEFRDTTVSEAVGVLRKKSEELDPQKKGLNFVLQAPADQAQTRINLSLKDTSLYDATRAVAGLAILVVVPEESALVLRPAGKKTP